MGLTKKKGDIGVAMVIADAMSRGHGVALPIGENLPYDLVVDRNGKLERIQVKYTESKGAIVEVRCRSTSETTQYKYTDKLIEWIAVYDKTTKCCYYVPAAVLGTGRNAIWLRLVPSKNRQKKGLHFAKDFLNF
jgi:hypothetical protein